MTGLPPDSSSLIQGVLQALAFQLNGEDVGSELALNLENGSQIYFSMVDDPANHRVVVQAAILGTAALDVAEVSATEVVAGTLEVTGEVSGPLRVAGLLTTDGDLVTGRQLVSGGGGTFTPELADGLWQQYTVAVAGATALTIEQPTENGVPFGVGSQTAILVVAIRNEAGSGGTALTWGSVFAFGSLAEPTEVLAGGRIRCFFVWDPDAVEWQCFAIQ